MESTQTLLHKHYETAGGVTAVFSSKVSDYIASRPDYPSALFDELATHCRLSQSTHVADVGAGTGLLTRGLLARGYRVTAIEPSHEMRNACDQLLAHNTQYQCCEGTAEAMPVEDQSIDLVAAATAFHWFKIDESRCESLRVLKPNGQVALIWNDRVLSDPLHIALGEVFAEFGGAKRDALIAHEDRRSVPSFFGGARPHEFTCVHTHALDADGLASLVFSRSYMPARGDEQGRRVADSVQRVFDRFAENGRVAVKYATIAYIARPSQRRS